MKHAIIENGVVANVAEAEAGFAQAQGWIPCGPDVGIGWAYDGETFAAPLLAPLPLPERAAAMADAVNAIRDDRTANAFVFAGVLFQLDDARSQPRITAMGADARFAVLGGAQPGNLRWADPDHDFGWIATDNSVMPMDAQTMVAFSDAAKLWVSRHTFAGAAIKKAIAAAEDHAALDAIDIEAGWPA